MSITVTICIDNVFLFSLTHLKNDPETMLKCLMMCYELLKVLSLSKGIGPTIKEIIESLVCRNKFSLHYGPRSGRCFVITSQSLCCICSAVPGVFKPSEHLESWRCSQDMLFRE